MLFDSVHKHFNLIAGYNPLSLNFNVSLYSCILDKKVYSKVMKLKQNSLQ